MKSNGELEHQDPEPQERSRGWYFPECLIALWREGRINAEDLMLLGIINSLCHPQKGCWASNTYLAKKWGKSSVRVSRIIALLRELKLIKVRIRRRPGSKNSRRIIYTTYQGDDLKSGGRKRLGEPSRKRPPIIRRCADAQSAASGNSSFGMGLEGKAHSRISKLCQRYKRFVLERYGRSVNDFLLNKWRLACENAISRVEGGFPRFKEVVKWYMSHSDEPWVSDYKSLILLCQNFHKVEKAMLRIQHQEARQNGDTPSHHRAPRAKIIGPVITYTSKEWMEELERDGLK